jgi:hypothetical protein
LCRLVTPDLSFSTLSPAPYTRQGRTLPKLIVNITTRPIAPYMDIVAFYVMISRVKSSNGLRLLRHDVNALRNIKGLVWSVELHAWNNGYNIRGEWDATRAVDALIAERGARTSRSMAKIPAGKGRVSSKVIPTKRPRAPPASTSNAKLVRPTKDGKKGNVADARTAAVAAFRQLSLARGAVYRQVRSHSFLCMPDNVPCGAIHISHSADLLDADR